MRSTQEIVEELCHAFRMAESASKRYEHKTGDLPIPVINELRYAGRHIVDALARGLDDSDKTRDQLDKAIRHCKRALYDDLEFRLVLVAERLEQCKSVYRDCEQIAARYIPHYAKHADVLRKAGDELEAAALLNKASEEYKSICERAIQAMEAFIKDYESAELVIITAKHLLQCQNEYKGQERIAARHIPHYFDHTKALQAKTRELENATQSGESAEECARIREELIHIMEEFMADYESAREVIYSEIDHEEKQARQTRVQGSRSWWQQAGTWIMMFITAVLTAVLTAMFTTRAQQPSPATPEPIADVQPLPPAPAPVADTPSSPAMPTPAN